MISWQHSGLTVGLESLCCLVAHCCNCKAPPVNSTRVAVWRTSKCGPQQHSLAGYKSGESQGWLLVFSQVSSCNPVLPKMHTVISVTLQESSLTFCGWLQCQVFVGRWWVALGLACLCSARDSWAQLMGFLLWLRTLLIAAVLELPRLNVALG